MLQKPSSLTHLALETCYKPIKLPLERFGKLTHLTLESSEYQISHLSPLSNLTHLTIKDLSQGPALFLKQLNHLTDVTIKACQNLEKLFLEDLSKLAYLEIEE